LTTIIDTHHHVDTCRVFDLEQDEEAVLRTMDENGVTATIIQPFPGAPDARAVHDHIARMAEDNPGRVFGLMSMSPHDPDAYREEAERCVRELGFVALKIHTIGHAVNPLGSAGAHIFETANQLGVPVMVHTGPGIPFAEPAMVLPRAREYADVTVILAHAGFGVLGGPTMAVAMDCPNIVLETSWAPGYDVEFAIDELGPERVMFGSDLVTNVAPELAKYRALGLDEATLDAVLGGTAREVFGLDL
jgi:uncharacterized protein